MDGQLDIALEVWEGERSNFQLNKNIDIKTWSTTWSWSCTPLFIVKTTTCACNMLKGLKSASVWIPLWGSVRQHPPFVSFIYSVRTAGSSQSSDKHESPWSVCPESCINTLCRTPTPSVQRLQHLFLRRCFQLWWKKIRKGIKWSSHTH